MKNFKTINITDKVMQRIDDENIQMRSAGYFKATKFLKLALTGLGLLISAFLIIALVYVFRNDLFGDYLSVASGKSLFIESLPWPGMIAVILSLGITGLLIVNLKNNYKNLRPAYGLAALVFVVIVSACFGYVVKADNTPSYFARAMFVSNKDPVDITVIIDSIDKKTIKVKTKEGKLLLMEFDGDISKLKTGDKLIIIGDKKGDIVYVKVYKVTEKAPVVIKKETPKPIEQPVVTPEPVETPKPVISKPIPTPTPTSPPAYVKTITINNVEKISSTLYYLHWSANFTLVNGYKAACSQTIHLPTYPPQYCNYQSGSASSGTTIIKKGEYGVVLGTYYIRLCEYIPSPSSCGVYSNTVTVTITSP